MANTYTQIHIHAVFVVKNRRSLIQETWEDRLYKYITGIVQKHNHKMLQVNGMPDHVHLFFGMRPSQSLSDLMKAVKGDSSKWINRKRLTPTKFSWQPGYGAFSHAQAQVPTVIRYIRNQKVHHARRSFAQEFRAFLEDFEVEYDERYLPIFRP